MIYVCSDIHGCYNRLMKLLKRVDFSDKDELYILGDVIDRNQHSIKTLLYVMERQQNIHLIMGNHEDFMYKHLSKVYQRKLLNPDYKEDLEQNFDIWFADCNGGRITYEQYLQLDEKTQIEIFKFLAKLPVIVLLDVEGRKYHLSHSGTLRNVLEKDIWTLADVNFQQRETIMWDSLYRFDGFISRRDYPEGYISIFGHVPVQRVRDNPNSYKIHKNGRTIDIDSGCAYYFAEPEGVKTALSCYCLNTEQTIYITTQENE